MTVHAQNSCTLSHITDVQAVYTYYYLASSDITSNMAPKDNVNAPGASTIRVTYDGVNYDWTLVEPSLNIIDDVIQTAVGKLYCIECTLFSDTTYDWGPLMTSSTYAAAKAAYNLSTQAVQTASDAYGIVVGVNQHFWTIAEDYAVGIPAGSYITDTAIDTFKTQKTGGNILTRSDGIWIRNGVRILSSLTGTGLTFYRPATNGSTYVQGKKAMDLTANALTFYKPLAYDSNNEPTAAAQLTSNGLVLSNGGIEAGEAGQTGFIYLSTEDYPLKDTQSSPTVAGLTINEYTPSAAGTDGRENDDPAWRQIIGTKFGVDSEGNLYASDVNIKGKITATSGEIGGWNIGTDTNKSLYYDNQTPGATTTNLVLSPTSATNSNAIGGSGTGLTWFISAGKVFGVTTAGALYATSGKIGGANITASNLYGNTRSAYNSGNGYYLGSDGKFGVGTTSNYLTFDGTNVNIKGGVTATSLTIGMTDVTNYANDITEISSKASGDAEYEVVVKVDEIDYTEGTAKLIAIPTKLGASTTGSFVWYKNAIGTAHGGTVTTTTNQNDTLTVTDLEALYIAVLQ